MKTPIQFQLAELSLVGDRETNQDRAAILSQAETVVGFVADGMGGHAGGEHAAMEAIHTLNDHWTAQKKALSNPKKFLRQTIADAHDAIVGLGEELSVDQRPRATCASFVIDKDKALWAHVGDSRVYLIRNGTVVSRTRDHTHVELLLQEGLISEEELIDHPLRSFVDNCLGGAPEMPNISLSKPHTLETGDIVLACSDGIWNGLDDRDIANFFAYHRPTDLNLQLALDQLGQAALDATSPAADNTTAVAAQWL